MPKLPANPGSFSKWRWWALGFAALVLPLAFQFLPLREFSQNLAQWIASLGWTGYLLFFAIYVLGTLLFFPGGALTIAAGAAFGLVGGASVALLAATTGAALAFIIARTLGRDYVSRKAASSPRFHQLDQAVGQRGWKIVALMRLSPVVPFNLINYFFGLTQVAFWPYVLVSFFTMAPGCLLYTYLGHIGQIALSAADHPRSPQEKTLLVLGLLATAGLSAYLTVLAKKALETTSAGKADPAGPIH